MSRSRSPSRTSKSRIQSQAERHLLDKVESQIDNLIDINEQRVKLDVVEHMMEMNSKLGLHEPPDGPPQTLREKRRKMALRKEELEKELSAAKDKIVNEFVNVIIIKSRPGE